MASAGLMLAAASLSACVGLPPPRGVLVPVPHTVAGTGRVDMLVATTRMKDGDPDAFFSGERAKTLSLAEFTVSIPPDATRRAGTIQWPKHVPGNPARDFVTLRADMVDLPEARRWAHAAIAKVPQKRVLVFIHGFNNRFEDAVFRFAQVVHDGGTPVVPVLFTWPSRGRLLAYGYDRESSTGSRGALEKVLATLVQDPDVGEVSILAHSMGTSLTLEALRQMAIRNGRVAAKIRNVVLASPDVDVDLFNEALSDMGEKRPRITLIVSRDDRALAASRRFWGDSTRLGAIDPEQEPYRSSLEAAGVVPIDLSRLKTEDLLKHSKYAQSPEIVRQIARQLAEGQTLTDSRLNTGDRIVQATTSIAATAGAAVGVVAAAPVAVVDPSTRATLSDNIGEVGRTAESVVSPP